MDGALQINITFCFGILQKRAAVIIKALLYGLETWATTRQQEQRIDASDTRCLGSILNIRWWHHTRNTEVREKTQQLYVFLALFGNVFLIFGMPSSTRLRCLQG